MGGAMKILYCDYKLPVLSGDAAEKLKELLPGCEMECCQYVDDELLIKKLENAEGLLTAHLKINKYVLDRAKKLKVISVDATGCGNIDLSAAKSNGIVVCSIGAYCTQEVADHGMLLILMLEKKIKQYMKLVEESHRYNYRELEPGHQLKGKRLAIFGLGRIGKALAERAKAFGYEVVAVPHDEKKIGMREEDILYVSCREAFHTADVISNNMSETADNFEFFNKEAFREMKKRPIFINLGRGSAVNEADLYQALKEGELSGAGLDVMKDVYPDLHTNPLVGMDNVIITPHMAFYSVESMEKIRQIPIMNLINALTGNYEKIANICR